MSLWAFNGKKVPPAPASCTTKGIKKASFLDALGTEVDATWHKHLQPKCTPAWRWRIPMTSVPSTGQGLQSCSGTAQICLSVQGGRANPWMPSGRTAVRAFTLPGTMLGLVLWVRYQGSLLEHWTVAMISFIDLICPWFYWLIGLCACRRIKIFAYLANRVNLRHDILCLLS